MFESNVFDSSSLLVGRVQEVMERDMSYVPQEAALSLPLSQECLADSVERKGRVWAFW